MENVQIQWLDVTKFAHVRGFIRARVPTEYHMPDAEALQMLLMQNLPQAVLHALAEDPDVRVFGLCAQPDSGAALFVGLPQLTKEHE
jgi:hypothetical protein